MHPAPSTSTQLIWSSIQLSAASSTLLEQNFITHNSAVFQNVGRKIQSWQKIGTDGILVVLILFYLKIRTHSIWRILILIPTSIFWIGDPKSIFGQIWAKKSKLSDLHENCPLRYLKGADSYSDVSFLNLKT